MIPKSFVISILLVGMMFLGVIGCGQDLEKPEELIKEKSEESGVESSTSPLANEELHGSWELVSIFGQTPKEYLESFTVGGEAEITVKHLNFVFAADDSWTFDLAEKTVMDFPDIPQATLEATGTWSGTYAFDGQTLSIFTKESEVHIATDPKDFFQVVFDRALAEAEQDYDEGVRSDLIQPFARSTATKQSNTLVLTTATGEEMVLEKQ
ncbi:hypothetical protein F4009_03335 [Candidatus Poribacteria bacterium]|nr:hypothetical protein [Candidatus Poribacteria bacterium]MYH79591.1 hypothetical protein [Candidatus Poribacteria bacterium]MYK93032.1 hypothetical protein [Candidatus Poribacteria bacterium]